MEDKNTKIVKKTSIFILNYMMLYNIKRNTTSF